MDEEGIEERAEYILNTTVNLFVTADQKMAATKYLGYQKYFIELKREEVPVYEKADTTSRIVASVPRGVKKLFVDFTVPALHGEGVFWHVAHYEDELSVSGYISADEIIM